MYSSHWVVKLSMNKIFFARRPISCRHCSMLSTALTKHPTSVSENLNIDSLFEWVFDSERRTVKDACWSSIITSSIHNKLQLKLMSMIVEKYSPPVCSKFVAEFLE